MILMTDPVEREFIEDGIYYYSGLLDDLDNLDEYEPIKNIVQPPLDSFQSVTLLKALVTKRYLLTHATGLGKTFIASAFMKALKNSKPSSKFLMVVKLDQRGQTPAKIKKISGLRTKFLDATENSLLKQSYIDNNDIIMITSNFLISPNHVRSLMRYIKRFRALVVDEAHLLSNLEEASSAYTLYALSSRIEYALFMTATPITSSVEQLARILKIMNPFDIVNFRKVGSRIKNYGLNSLPDKILDTISIRDRPNLRKGIAVWVPAMPNQLGAKGKDLFKITKSFGAEAQANKLADLILNENKGRKGLVYVNLTEVYRFLIPFLENKGIRVDYINGKITSRQERTRKIDRFKNGDLDVLLSNSCEALDIDADYVVFYEFTNRVKQFIGRGERGLEAKRMNVYFIFTKDTDEYDYFLRNVYNISMEVQELLGMDYHEILNIV